jgi:hypothetical protein
MSIQHQVTLNFLSAYHDLHSKGIVKAGYVFAKSIGMHQSAFSNILKGKQNITVHHLQDFIIKYNVNPCIIFNYPVAGATVAIKLDRIKIDEEVYIKKSDLSLLLDYITNFIHQ